MFYLTHPARVARALRQFDADVARTPALDIAEDDKAYSVTVDMPGVTKEAVKVRVEGRRVHIETASADADAAAPTDGSRVLYRERRAASYARSFSLPVEIDQAQSQARFNNGVLTLTLVKRVAENGGQLNVL